MQDDILESNMALAARSKKGLEGNLDVKVKESLQVVNLDESLSDEFETLFFERSRSKLASMSLNVSKSIISVNHLIYFLRHALSRGYMSNHVDVNDKQALADFFTHSYDMAKSTLASQTASSKNGHLVESTSAYLGSMVGGSKHSLRESKVYEGGIDVVCRSNPYDIALLGMSGVDACGIPERKDQGSYDDEYLRSYASEVCDRIRAAGEAVLNHLTGGESSSNVTKCVNVNLPLTFDFEKLNDIVEGILGFSFPEPLVQNVEPIDKKIGKKNVNLNDYYSLELVITNNSRLSSEVRRSVEQSHNESQDSPETLRDRSVIIEERINANASNEIRAVGRNVGAAITLSFPEPLARYISQTPSPATIDLSSFDTWFQIWSSQFLRAKGRYAKESVTGGRLSLRSIPRYCLPISTVNEFSGKRAGLGMSVENTRANEDGIYVTTTGRLACGFKADEDTDHVNETCLEYQKTSKKVMEICRSYGVSSSDIRGGLVRASINGMSYDDFIEAKEALYSLSKFDGRIVGFNWDTGLTLRASKTRLGVPIATRETGAVVPDELVIADYLGYDIERTGTSGKSLGACVTLMTEDDPVGDDPEGTGFFSSSKSFTESMLIKNIVKIYALASYEGKVDLIDELRNAAVETKLADPSNEAYANFFKFIVDKNGDPQNHSGFDARALAKDTASGSVVNNYLNAIVKHAFELSDPLYTTVIMRESVISGIEVEEHPYYYSFTKSPSHGIANMYGHFAGNMFQRMLKYVADMPSAEINSITKNERGFSSPPPNEILNKIKPFCVVYGKYAPNYAEYELAADRAVDSISLDSSVSAEDVHLPGSSDGFSLFPHQVDTHKYLRKSSPPKFAIFDIQPGGGKTTLALTDIASMIDDIANARSDFGQDLRAAIIVPDGLIGNFCNDMKDFTGDNWNMIPLNTEIFDRWGADKIRTMIETAPKNTIVVVGMQFIVGRSMPITIGNSVLQLSTTLEFVRSLGFNYLAIDESHKLKKFTSARHRAIKTLTTSPNVKFLRILTGTLIADRVRDIEGQVALYSPHIFRRGELTRATELSSTASSVPTWRIESPQAARNKLSKYAAVITKKRKEWAFMLPSPIEKFYPVQFNSMNEYTVGGSDTPDQFALGELHEALYNAVVSQTVEELQKELQLSKRRKTDDDDDDTDSSGPDMEFSEDEELAAIPADKLETYLARIERLLVAPQYDPLFEDFFGKKGVTELHSRKARVVASLVKEHFTTPDWKAGTYKLDNLVIYNGDLYLSRAPKGENISEIPVELRNQTPDQSDYYRKEPGGKVIVFCRYTNSVNAVYDALPANFKKQAVKFTGEESNKWANLERFRNDDDIQILVANEQGLSEGHNLQMASRLIRVESPWGPGELSQTSSRVFRPDPKGALAGNIFRDIIFLDWVLCDNTMEVAKQGRLISKMLDAVRFEEAGNPNYSEVHDLMLPPVSMSLSVLQGPLSLMDDYSDYFEAYSLLNSVQRAEFDDMRNNRPANMLPVPPTSMFEGAYKIKVPFYALQDNPGYPEFNPVNLTRMQRDENTVKYSEDPDLLVGKPVITDEGFGVIVNVNTRRDSKEISSVQVRYHGQTVEDEPERLPATVVFLVTKCTNDSFKEFFEAPTAYTAKQIQEFRKAEEAKEKASESTSRRKKRVAATAKDIQGRVDAVDVSGKRRSNRDKGIPINTGIQKVSSIDIHTGNKGTSNPVDIELHPAYYHQYLTLETDMLEDASLFKKMKFKHIGEYAYIRLSRRNQINAICDFLEDEARFHLSDATIDRLSAVFESFEQGKRGLYSMELAPQSTLPNFFVVNKRMVKNPKEIRVYPLFMDNELTLIVDIKTCPVIRKYIGKSVPGANAKWMLSPGALMYFAENKTDLKRKVREVETAGYNVVNKDHLREEVASIKFRRRSSK